MRTRVVVYVAGVLVMVAGVGVVAWRVLGAGSTYEQSLGTLPNATLRASYTDWQVVREQALEKGSSTRDVVLHLKPRSGPTQVLSDISTGPILFATC